MGKPVLSVCLITYNQAKYVKEAIDSVLAQKVDFAWELVIADDHSTDGTREILLEYRKQHPDIIKLILQKSNVGAEKNWHDLLAYPASKYIAYLEGDDYWTDPNKLQLQVDFLEANPDYVLCFHPAKVFFENGEEKQTTWPKLSSEAKLTIGELLKENFIPSNTVVYRRRKYEHLPTGIMPGDWYLHLYYAQFGKIGYINRTMSAYRRHTGGVWWDSYKDQTAFWKKHGLATLTLYSEFMKLYGDNEEYRQIISKGASATLGSLIEVDTKQDSKLIKQAMRELPDITESALTYYQFRQKELSEEAQTKRQEVEDLTLEVLDLRATAFRLRDELHTLLNSRVLGKVIKLRELVGSLRHKIVRIPHGVRVIAAPLFPATIRKSLKRVYKVVKGASRRELPLRPVVAVGVANSPWGKDVPLVSVVIPYYNRADTIDDTLNSLMAQTFTNFEIILVNDGSTDQASVKKLQHLKAGTFKFIIINQENMGVAAARNNGIAKAKGKYIVCLDSDDMIEPSYIEKCTMVLETNPDIALVTAYMQMFGVRSELFQHVPYDPMRLYRDNMVITAAEFRRSAWEQSDGYKSGIGYEDWDFWLTLAERGYWGKQLPEVLFHYRAALQSRYVDDKDIHWNNIKTIHSLHTQYKAKVKRLLDKRRYSKHVVSSATALVNMKNPAHFAQSGNHRKRILIAIPWMTFGGAETLVLNFSRELQEDYNLAFVTGLRSEHEWEYKFRELTPDIYHLPELFDDPAVYVEFISNYIETRNVDIVHMVHTNFMFGMLETLRKRHPHVKFILTMFNDRVPEYFAPSVELHDLIDIYTTDNFATGNHYRQELPVGKLVTVIPNGIDCTHIFKPTLYDQAKERKILGLSPGELAIFFIGRLSEEKNPDVFVEVANRFASEGKASNARFFVVGDGHMRSKVEKMIKEVKPGLITYLGYRSEVANVLAAADVFVLPSSIEGFPLSILEAMAMDVAVVASDVGAVNDVLETGKDGFVVSPGSVDEIKEAIEKLCADPKLLATIKRNAQQKLRANYSSDVLRNNYIDLYKKTTE